VLKKDIMKNLFRVTTVQVNGFTEIENETYSHMISESEILEDDYEITQEDVVEADEVFLEYNKYENLGEITDDEIKTLIKFKVISQ
jgi:hypothetical protein